MDTFPPTTITEQHKTLLPLVTTSSNCIFLVPGLVPRPASLARRPAGGPPRPPPRQCSATTLRADPTLPPPPPPENTNINTSTDLA